MTSLLPAYSQLQINDGSFLFFLNPPPPNVMQNKENNIRKMYIWLTTQLMIPLAWYIIQALARCHHCPLSTALTQMTKQLIFFFFFSGFESQLTNHRRLTDIKLLINENLVYIFFVVEVFVFILFPTKLSCNNLDVYGLFIIMRTEHTFRKIDSDWITCSKRAECSNLKVSLQMDLIP